MSAIDPALAELIVTVSGHGDQFMKLYFQLESLELRFKQLEAKYQRIRKTHPPDDVIEWLVANEKVCDWCVRVKPELFDDLNEHVEECFDHFLSKGEGKANWPATVRNWLRRVKRFAPTGIGGTSAPAAAATRESFRDADARKVEDDLRDFRNRTERGTEDGSEWDPF